MAGPLYANNVAGTLAANIGPSDTGVLLGAGQGALFPAIAGGNYYYATLVHQATGLIEVVKVTGKSADTLTVVRGQDGTGAISFNTGSLVEMRLVAQALRELDYRNAMGIANGLATLDGTTKIPIGQLSAQVPILDIITGKLPLTVFPPEVAMDSELAGKANLSGGTFTGGVTFAANVQIDPGGAGAVTLAIGNDAHFVDANVAHALALRSSTNAALGFLYFGNAGHYIGWNGGVMVSDGQMIWTAGNFDPNAKLNVTNPIATGDIVATGRMQSNAGYFSSGTGHLVLSANSGPLYLRPFGADNATNQGIINTSGLAQFVDVQSYSDKTMKKHIRRRYARTELVDQIQFKDWKRKSDGRFGLGVVAQDLLPFAPEYVGEGEDGKLSVDYAGLALELVLGLGTRLRRVEAALNLKVK